LAHITESIIPNGSWARTRKDTTGEINFLPNFEKGIVQLSLIPGLEPKLLENLIENKECKGIVLQSFGAGNVPSEAAGAKYAWENFIRHAKDCGKPVLITSQFPANATSHTVYEPGVAAIDAGAIPTGNMTSACATAKFRWVLAQVGNIEDKQEKLDRIRDMMNTDYVGEFDMA
jgi:L-asparaginase/Glu-tRNA(Gln) amidotransferase subunit D